MEFRKALETDMVNIMGIIEQAQAYFKEQGINQWQNNYPNLNTIKNDIDQGYTYVLLKDHQIIGTAAVIFDGERTYNTIYKGQWLTDEQYVVIHRIAVDLNHKGLGVSSVILKNVEDMCRQGEILSIKIDTHKDNLSMKRFLQKNEFEYCGVIYLEDGNERLAFEKTLTDR